MSDHRLLTITTNMILSSDNRPAAQDISYEGYDSLCFKSSKVDWPMIKQELMEVNWRPLMGPDPNQNLQVLHEEVFKVCERYVPRRAPPRNCRGIPRTRRILLRQKTKLNKRIMRNTNNAHRSKMLRKIRGIEEKLKQLHDDDRDARETKAIAKLLAHNAHNRAFTRSG